MSDNIPFEIQVEIMKRLPVKSVIQCRSVSKAWKSLIDSKDFISGYTGHFTQTPPHMLIRSEVPKNYYKEKYVSIDDDNSFPRHKFTLTNNLPLHVKQLQYSAVLGCSHGLFFLHGYFRNPSDSRPYSTTKMAVLWNPSIRKSVAIDLPDVNLPYETVVGFGVCPHSCDPILVKITQIKSLKDLEDKSSSIPPLQVEVFTLSSGAWRSPLCSNNAPRKSIHFRWSQVVIDKFIYWFAYDVMIIGGGYQSFNLIMSFDMKSEEFAHISLPYCLALHLDNDLPISKLKESLVVLEYDKEEDNRVYSIWMMMEDGVTKSFTKLYSINLPDASVKRLPGFRNNGEPLIYIRYFKARKGKGGLYVYEPYSKHIKYIGVYGLDYSLFVGSYMETLLLLDH